MVDVASAAQRSVAASVARATESQKQSQKNVNKPAAQTVTRSTQTTAARSATPQTVSRAAVSRATTANVGARATTGTPSRGNVGGTLGAVSRRIQSAAHIITSRAGNVTGTVLQRNLTKGGTDDATNGTNADALEIRFDDALKDKYPNLKMYARVFGGNKILIAKNKNDRPDLTKFFSSMRNDNFNINVNGAFADYSGNGTGGAGYIEQEMIISEMGEKTISDEEFESFSEPVKIVTAGSINTSISTGCPSEEVVNQTINTWNSYNPSDEDNVTYIKTVKKADTVGENCAIIVKDADGFYRMARWNDANETYGWFKKTITYGDVIVGCEDNTCDNITTSDLMGTVDVMTNSTALVRNTKYPHMTFEDIRVGVLPDGTLPSMAPLNALMGRSNFTSNVRLSGIYNASQITVGEPSGTLLWDADGVPQKKVSAMTEFGDDQLHRQGFHFAYAKWESGALTLGNCPGITDTDYTGYDTKEGDTQVAKARQKAKSFPVDIFADCEIVVKDRHGMCFALTAAEAGHNNGGSKGNRVMVPCNEYKIVNNEYNVCDPETDTCQGYNIVNDDELHFTNQVAINLYIDQSGANQGHLEYADGTGDIIDYRIRIMLPDGSVSYQPTGTSNGVILPDLTKIIANTRHSKGKVFRGIHGDLDADDTKSRWYYDETGKPINWIIDQRQIPSKAKGFMDTGGRPYYMFMLWCDEGQTVDENHNCVAAPVDEDDPDKSLAPVAKSWANATWGVVTEDVGGATETVALLGDEENHVCLLVQKGNDDKLKADMARCDLDMGIFSGGD